MSRAQQVEVYRRRLRAVWAGTSRSRRQEGRHWYRRAHAECVRLARAHGLPLRPVAAVVAAVSPGLRWERNIHHAEQILRAAAGWRDCPTVPTYNQRWARDACRLAELAITMHQSGLKGPGAWWERMIAPVVSGPKRTAFYRLLRDGGNASDVCVDGHIAAVCWTPAGQPRPTNPGNTFTDRASGGLGRDVTPLQYAMIAQAVRLEAATEGVRPCDYQATVWLEWRER